MIKTFLSIRVNENGSYININDTETHSIFKNNNLLIYSDEIFFYKHFGMYPVIYLDLKVDYDQITSYKTAINVLREKVHEAFNQHKYLTISNSLDSEQKKLCSEWCGEIRYETLSNRQVKKGLINLAKFLYLHYNTKVFLLVDEYDSMVMAAMFEANVVELSKIVRLVIGQICALCKTNDHVGNGIITGVSYIAGGEFSNLNNFQIYKFLDNHPFVKFYGFRQSEVNKLFDNPLFGLDKDKIQDALFWYNGYICKNGKTIYNPFSILNFLNSGVIKNYWADSSHIENLYIILKNKNILKKLEDLLTFNNVSVKIYQSVNIHHLLELKTIYEKNPLIPNYDVLFTHLLEIGYLSFPSAQGEMKCKEMLLRIPNFEIWDNIVEEIVDVFKLRECYRFEKISHDIKEALVKSYEQTKDDLNEKGLSLVSSNTLMLSKFKKSFYDFFQLIFN